MSSLPYGDIVGRLFTHMAGVGWTLREKIENPSETVGMDEFSWFVSFARVHVVFVFKKKKFLYWNLRYYSLGVSSIVDAFLRSKFGISSWHGSRVDGRPYLQSGAIDGSEANGIIRRSQVGNREFVLLLIEYLLVMGALM
ncbi:hypothetical protein Tco_0002452 [Tanacetum coccineum]